MKKIILSAVVMTTMMLSSCGDDASKEGTSGASKEGTSGASKEGSSDVSKEGSSDASKEVTIGSQVWMTKNLDVSTFRNGDPIPHAKTAICFRGFGYT